MSLPQSDRLLQRRSPRQLAPVHNHRDIGPSALEVQRQRIRKEREDRPGDQRQDEVVQHLQRDDLAANEHGVEAACAKARRRRRGRRRSRAARRGHRCPASEEAALGECQLSIRVGGDAR